MVNHDAVFVRTDIFRLGHHQDAELKAHADLHLVLDAETQFQRDVSIVGVDFEALEVFKAAAIGILQGVAVRV